MKVWHYLRHPLTLLTLILALIITALPLKASDDLLDPDDAFRLQPVQVIDGQLAISWQVAPGYYLYQDRLGVESADIQLQAIQFPPAKDKNDPFFGQVKIYDKDFTLRVPYQGQAQQATLTIRYQGCAEEFGVCYPPQTQQVAVNLPAQATVSSTSAATASLPNEISSLRALNDFLASQTGLTDTGLLDVDQAFAFSYRQNGEGQLLANWNMADGYYLYRDKISATIVSGQATIQGVVTPAGLMKDDPLFGQVEVYYGQATADITITDLQGPVVVEIGYQGCADVGVCYPPETRQINLDPATFGTASAASIAAAGAASAMPSTVSSLTSAPPTDPSQMSEADRITNTLMNANLWIVVLTFFIFGLLLSFTPCVFPMIPILSSIIVGQGNQNITARKGFIISLVFVLSMALAYTIAGVLAGIFGANLQAALQNPWVLGTFAIIFVLLALSMFGFYEIQLPSSLQSKITQLSNKQKGGSLTGVAIMGFLSALIVGPCVAPPLAGALIYIGQTGDAVLGGLALFAMSLGMGVPLLLLGASAGKLLPRAGAWMNTVKAVFGVLLLAVALWLADRVLPGWISMIGWALLLIVAAIYMGALEPIGDKSNWHKLWKGLGLSLLVTGFVIIIGLAGGSRDLLQPLKVFQGGGTAAQQQAELKFEYINSIEELQARVGQGQPVMLDFYADWCVSCIEMERFTFSDPQVQAALDGVVLLKADVTANTADHRALMRELGIVGPPAILFYNPAGVEQRGQRVVGFKNATEFKATIDAALGR
ncbi:protein-disulfide reductase [Thiomicrospira aerophila AL3]|uniref:Thiol:disulfide interchange protein DsbD n=1 Tax=Thiomicrospira aerophila AL3 TaxID=717772 RepID=W0DXM5_9GAMM|nr:protein-disulfide reductase DsbD [Thiomicrospira aerophila]AHF01719.1 protein-disulfide reductase [Thiomicrospira aerophila AL3]